MAIVENPDFRLPDAKAFLEGKEGIKPLQHKADALLQFAAGFEDVPLNPKASETLVQLGDVMKRPNWAGAHNAAHDAITTARRLVTENPPEDLAKLSYMVETIGNARAPHVDTVKGIRHPILEETLKPLVSYLEEFGSLVSGWVGLSPSRMRPKDEGAITPAQHRADAQALLDTMKTKNPDMKIPDCGDIHCTIDHGTGAHTPMPAPTPATAGHVHTPGCGHNHTPVPPPGSNVHYHGSTPCSHPHPHEPHLAKGQSSAGWWIAGIVATVAVGAYLMKEYGKPSTIDTSRKAADWKDRAKASTEQQTASASATPGL